LSRPLLPDDLPVVERSAVRLVVLDADGKLLLLRTRDLDHPDLGLWWDLPGGGLEDGETYLEAAVRELREEAGIVAAPEQIGRPTWRRSASFRVHRARYVQDEVVVRVQLAGPGPDVDGSGRVDFEHEDYIGFGWWTVPEVCASDERFYPGRLPELLEAFLAGEEIDEPFELWS
jgi:8-oxo-dGTP pyrophosphatase MutT (NUDIX family)